MTGTRKSRLGKVLVGLGCAWFMLSLAWISPLKIVMDLLMPLGKASFAANRLAGRVEFPLAAATAAVGALLWRRATRKLSVADYVVVLAGASLAVLAVFRFNGWIRL